MGQCQTSLLQDPATMDASGHLHLHLQQQQKPCHAHPAFKVDDDKSRSHRRRDTTASTELLTSNTVHSLDATAKTHDSSSSNPALVVLDDWSSIDLPVPEDGIPSSVLPRSKRRTTTTAAATGMDESATSFTTTESRRRRSRRSSHTTTTDSMQRRAQEVQARYRRDGCCSSVDGSVMSSESQMARLARTLDGRPKREADSNKTTNADKLPVQLPQ